MTAQIVGPLRFSRIVVVFEPNPAKIALYLSRQLCAELAKRMPEIPVNQLPTSHAGHGRELARAAAQQSLASPSGGQVVGELPVLIVSVSGDGGFNDVVNGAMDVPNSTAICIVLAAGNANDHRRSVASMSVVDAIVAGPIRHMDQLQLTVRDGAGPPMERYVHSYVGFGLTAAMARGIENSGKGRVRELFGVVVTLPRLQSFEIVRPDGARGWFDSLVLANVNEMAKYGTVSDSRIPSDGKFEVIFLPHTTRWALAMMTLRAVTVGLGRQLSVSRYEFSTEVPLPGQFDGEIFDVPSGASVVVESAHRAIRTLG
ncbi:diacylglycerol kinase family protein [Arthrobacter sp. E3]|uniref:diacylglycerol/lipid kinase family protein n=1 Tax=Arthrobacter sp. E3 TaxID=517402 RepID=UPI001A93E80A|nr:diacylglycerol kinase family protein [Arthrobacter sp. E3]